MNKNGFKEVIFHVQYILKYNVYCTILSVKGSGITCIFPVVLMTSDLQISRN